MTEMYTKAQHRHDFVLLFDVLDGNPNGDPDGGNLPRVDVETMAGLVTDVCLKRKIRNWMAVYADLLADDHPDKARLKLFVKHHGVLNDSIREAYIAEGLPVSTPVEEPVTEAKVLAALRQLQNDLPSAFHFSDVIEDEAEEDGSEDGVSDVVPTLYYSGELDEAELKEQLKEVESHPAWKSASKFVNATAKKAGKPKKSVANANKAKTWMCANFYDVRMFGAVMSTGLNAGQVRGPMQLTFSRSLDPVLPEDLAVTRVAVTDAKDREKLQTIGRKTKIPYGLYRGYGFFSPALAKQTGVTDDDLKLFWEAIQGMFENVDRSASRGLMALRGLYIFSHEKPLGNAPAHKLFERIQIAKKEDGTVPRSFADYQCEIDEDNLPEGITLKKLVCD
ncbi:MAG: type I-C CRISPR-associated protein Cas7/Csd2 [Spirulinaceae cyanobacterium SM2_1_0]|nr:type I-C CRISPR-associated protein Cas7/Csd2 [Spirulinaceae cyanobacterium SM2_1_0]